MHSIYCILHSVLCCFCCLQLSPDVTVLPHTQNHLITVYPFAPLPLPAAASPLFLADGLPCPCWLQLFRLLWLYSTLYGLAGLGTRADQYTYPESWRLALGRIAAASPVLVAGQSGVVFLPRVAA